MRIPKGWYFFDPSISSYEEVISCYRKMEEIGDVDLFVVCEPIYGIFTIAKKDFFSDKYYAVVSQGSIASSSNHCDIDSYISETDVWGKAIKVSAEKLIRTKAKSFSELSFEFCKESPVSENEMA